MIMHETEYCFMAFVLSTIFNQLVQEKIIQRRSMFYTHDRFNNLFPSKTKVQYKVLISYNIVLDWVLLYLSETFTLKSNSGPFRQEIISNKIFSSRELCNKISGNKFTPFHFKGTKCLILLKLTKISSRAMNSDLTSIYLIFFQKYIYIFV